MGLAAFLRHPASYPFFAKPIQGKYSLSILSADDRDAAGDIVFLRGAGALGVEGMIRALTAREDGFLIQRRLEPPPKIVRAFGDRLWSIRLLVLLTPGGPVIHRATAKIPAGDNPADNYWRLGNLLGALDLETGRIERVTSGWAEGLVVHDAHPNSGASLIGLTVPGWAGIASLAKAAAPHLAGIGTQSWDIAVTDAGPVILEANFGGDLSLSQIASGRGTLDGNYRDHLAQHGYTVG